MKSFLWVAALALPVFACTSSSTGPGSGGSGPGSGDGGSDDHSCYGDARVGCQVFTWEDITKAIELVYGVDENYYGYDQEEATDLARELFDNGVVSGARIGIVRVAGPQDTERFVVSVSDETGFPAKGLTVDQIGFAAGDEAVPAARVVRLGDATTSDLHMRLSVIVDDSGSIRDCDANFIADGLAFLFGELPPIYEAELIKFESEIQQASEFSSDGEVLQEAALTTCTDRGKTSLWDATQLGVEHLGATGAGGELELAVVITDGFDNDSSATAGSVIDAAVDANVPVLVVGIGFVDPFSLLTVAAETSGGFVYVPTGDKAAEALENATGFVTDAYVVDLAAGTEATEIVVVLNDDTTLRADLPLAAE